MGVIGSKFRTRLVVVSLLLSFLPVIAMFWFSYGLMNRSIDKWFSQPVEEVRADTAAMASLISDYAGQNATTEAQSIAQSEEVTRRSRAEISRPRLDEFREHPQRCKADLSGSDQRESRASQSCQPAPGREMKEHFPIRRRRCAENIHISSGTRRTTLSARRRWAKARSSLPCRCPRNSRRPNKQIQESQQRYIELARQRKLVRRTYIGFLSAADGTGVVRIDLAGTVSFEAGEPSGSGAGGGDGGDFQRTTRLSR